MATALENLQTIRTNLIAALLTESASPKPNYSIDGQSMSWNDYRISLLSQIRTLDELIGAEDPFEISSYAQVTDSTNPFTP